MVEFRKEALEEEFSWGKSNGKVVLPRASVFLMLLTLLVMAAAFLAWGVLGSVTDKAHMQGVMFPVEGTSVVSVPNRGVVRSLMVHKGDHVQPGQILAMIDVNGQYSTLTAGEAGEVLSVLQEQETFEAFEPIVNLLAESSRQQVVTLIAYADFKTLRELEPGQEVQVNPAFLSREKNGYVPARIVNISRFPISAREAAQRVKNPQFIQNVFPADGSAFEVEVELQTVPGKPEVLDWTIRQEKPVDMSTGTLCEVQVITKRRSVFRYLFENIREKYNAAHEVVLE